MPSVEPDLRSQKVKSRGMNLLGETDRVMLEFCHSVKVQKGLSLLRRLSPLQVKTRAGTGVKRRNLSISTRLGNVPHRTSGNDKKLVSSLHR